MKPFASLANDRFCQIKLLIIFLCLLCTRRWQQLVAPEVWNEDALIMNTFISLGARTFLEPVAGYLITVPKLISAISLKISFLYYPLISTVLAWLFIAFVGCAITLSPTRLRGKFLCAVAVFIIPADPEVFGLPLYTFWWASLLLFLVALWDKQDRLNSWRVFFLLIGGFSSPLIVLILPVLYFRAFWYKSLRSEMMMAMLATIIAGVQFIFILNDVSGKIPPVDSMLKNAIPVFFGRFLVGNLIDSHIGLWFAGISLILVIGGCFLQNRRNLTFWILLYLLVGSIATTLIRIDPAIIHPIIAGPRYFFFPFILIYWFLIQCFRGGSYPVWTLIGVLGVTSMANAFPAWSRTHDDLHWTTHVRSCRFFPNYPIPVHTSGAEGATWSLELAGEVCQQLLERDLFFQIKQDDQFATYPYSLFKDIKSDSESNNGNPVILSSSISGTDYQKSVLDGYQVTGSFITSDSDIGEITLRLHRGDTLFYRSDTSMKNQLLTIVGHENQYIRELPAASEWSTMSFSNRSLPEEFVIKISDRGKGWGEWFAIAIKK